MASEVPQLPKNIAQYINRANELEKADPVISYFCKLFAVEEILDKSLHSTNDDISKFAIGLLDDIESIKNGEDEDLKEIIQDKETSISYVLAFSNKIFQNSLNQITQHNSSKSTALSFLAFVNFIDLLKLWEDDYESLVISEEITKKIKYAKFHAARIIKTLKKGEDPNEYDPPELELKSSEPIEPTDDDSNIPIVEPDGSNSDGFGLPDITPTIPISKSPTPFTPKEIKTDSLGLPEPPRSQPSHTDDIDESTATDEVSLPEIPKFLPDDEPVLPSAPKTIRQSSPSPSPSPPPQAKPTSPPKQHKQINVQEILESSEIFTKAQKHAKFAISALNYEDTDTALKQLNEAIALLEQLKASQL